MSVLFMSRLFSLCLAAIAAFPSNCSDIEKFLENNPPAQRDIDIHDVYDIDEKSLSDGNLLVIIKTYRAAGKTEYLDVTYSKAGKIVRQEIVDLKERKGEWYNPVLGSKRLKESASKLKF